MEEIKIHPVQKNYNLRKQQSYCPQVVTLRAYEVYCEIFGEQPAIIEGNCRGGFGTGELIAFLYAHSFPKSEWHTKYEEASKGMINMG